MSATGIEPKPSAEIGALSIHEALELAKRAFALKKYEQAVDHYATALELMTEQHGDNAPEAADLYFSYGKALLENAIAQSSVLGKDKAEDNLVGAKDEDTSSGGAFLSFSGDVEEGDDVPVDLFGDASKAVEEADAEEEDEAEDGDGEPEDDFNAAWEVLDLARALYAKREDEDDEIKLKLAETYISLGDVSLETEKFDQAIQDYTAGLDLKIELLPQSSRQIAEAHYKLSMVLDLSSGRLQDSIVHAEKALESVEARLAELRNAASGQLKIETLQKPDSKGKGKALAKGPRLLGDDAVQNLSAAQISAEVKELEELKQDVALKVEELKTIPNEPAMSAPALAAKALDQELNVTGSRAAGPADHLPVNDLTSVVKKKKKPIAEANTAEGNGEPNGTSATKRKADDDGLNSPTDKKARVELDTPATEAAAS